MASRLYTKFIDAHFTGGSNLVNLATDDVRAILVDLTDYTLDIDNDEYLDDIPAGARVATTGALTGQSFAARVFDANNITFTSVSGDQSEYIVLYKHTGTEGTSRLIGIVDTATGLPVTPSGGNIPVTWSDGADRIFRI